MNTPNVVTFSVDDNQGRPVRFTVSTDIVDYMASAETFGRDLSDPFADGRFERRMVALPDKRAAVVTPLVLTMSNQNELYLVRKDDGTGSSVGEWTLTDLSSAFKESNGSTRRVRAFGAGWTEDDRITVAVAVDDDPSGRSRIFVAYDLSSRTTDWAKIAWQDCGIRDDIRVEGFRVLDDGEGHWTIVVAGDRGPHDMLYLLSSKLKQTFQQALVFNPAVTLAEILDFEVIRHPTLGEGIAVLGISGNTRDLSFRSFPTKEIPIPSIVPLPCPKGANVLEAGLTRKVGRSGKLLGSDLYIGGQGVHLIPAKELYNQADAKTIQVANPEAAPDVQDVVVGDSSASHTSIWALLQNAGLIVVKSAADQGAAWGTPLQLRKAVQQIAPVHGDDHATTSVLVVYTDGKAASIWQDAKTGAWNEAPLLVANPSRVTKITCFGTSLRYLDGSGLPQPGKIVQVSASMLASVILNGKTVFIGPGLQVEAKTDVNGSINLYDRVRSLTPAIYRFTMSDIDDSLDVNPAASAHQRFKKIKADELRKAMVPKPGGGTEPLLASNFAIGGKDANQVDGVAAALNRVSTLATSTMGAVAPGVSKVSVGSAFSSALQNSSLPQDFKVGIKSTATGVQTLDSRAITILVNSTNSVEKFFVDLGDTIVDFFEGLAQRVQEAWEFVIHKVEDGFRFICKIGDKIKHFVLDTLEQAGSFFTWLWEQIETGLEKVWDFLKFLFEWDDVLIARDVMVKATDEALLYLKNSTAMLKQTVDVGFDYATAIIRQWQTEIGAPPAKLPKPAPGTSVADRLQNFTTAQQSLHDQITGNSVIGWVTQKLDSVLDGIVQIEGADPSDVAINAAVDFIGGLIGDEFDNLIHTWDQIQADVLKIFGNKLPDNDSLGLETIKNLMITVGADSVIGLLEGIRKLVLRSLDLLGSMIEVVRAAMFAKISFPFIEKLVELVLPGTEIDTSFRLIDAIMLLIAVPSTIAYKLIFDEAPFKKDDILTLPFGRVAVQSQPAAAFMPYVGLVGGFMKLVMAGYLTRKAFQTETAGAAGPVNKPAIIIGLVLSGFGLATEVLSQHDPDKEHQGSTVGALEMSAVGAVSFCLVSSVAFATGKWKAKSGHVKVDAGVTIAGTIAQIGVGAAVFGVLIDYLRQSGEQYDQMRQATESYRWIGRLFDQVGTILFASAAIDPELETKSALCAFGSSLKANSLICSIGQVTTLKLVVDPLQK